MTESFDTLFDAALTLPAPTEFDVEPIDDLSGDVLQIDSDPYEGVLHVSDDPDHETFVVNGDDDADSDGADNNDDDESLSFDAATTEDADATTADVASEEPYDVLFDVILESEAQTTVVGAPLQQDEAFDAELSARAATDSPLLQQKSAEPKRRDFEMDTGPVFAPAGASTVVTVTPQCYFRAQKIIATDTATPPGSGTRVTMVNIGQKVQRMGAGGTLTSFFNANALGNGVDFDTNHPWEEIQITVSFIQSCTFDLSLFGEAMIL